MWGYISTEASYQLNFNVGFSTNRSDVLIHLSQWQYWWWFWFSLVWSFYYLLTSRIVRFRTLKMRPKISTSFRPHGKWGDFLACIIPMIWCVNILTNSNFILRLIEWQNESSLFTVRVRARQWYWIYKFELKNFTDILTAPKNIGTNKWVISTFGDLQVADDYMHILQLRSQNKWVKKYWSNVLKNSGKSNKYHLVSAQEQFKGFLSEEWKNQFIFNTIKTYSNNHLLNFDLNIQFSSPFRYKTENSINSSLNFGFLSSLKNFQEKKNSIFNSFYNFQVDKKVLAHDTFNLIIKKEDSKTKSLTTKILLPFAFKNSLYDSLNFNDFFENNRFIKRSNSVIKPIRFIKLPLSMDINLLENLKKSPENLDLLRLRFNNESQKYVYKNYSNNPYLTIKQKKYTRKKTITSLTRVIKIGDEVDFKKTRSSIKPVLIQNKFIEENKFNSSIEYNLLRKNKIRNDLIPVNLARRLLRTKKTLVLPAHINITLITNSYDIIHSWFIPGLGIKLDCVPGRSTHHTFYIDNVGFYYGQCAEICGRFHHHMPIRVCALPFEHFLVWWHTFGLPKLLFTTSQKNLEVNYAFRKYVW